MFNIGPNTFKMKLCVLTVLVLHFCLNGESTAAPYEATGNLTAVVIMYVHGDRTAPYSYPNDPYYSREYVPEGFGVFLNKGKLRQLKLGEWLRQRYDSYISETYKEGDIDVYSADMNVCLQSAQSNLAGLYKLKTKDQWYPGLAWDAVPIHTNAIKNDHVFSLDGRCSRYDEKLQEIKQLQNFTDLLKENAEMIKFLSEKSGWEITDIVFVEVLYAIFDIYRNYNSSYIPSWSQEVNQTKFTQMAGISWARETYTTELRRLKTGLFFYNLFQYFSQRAGNFNNAPKMAMISTTTSALTAVLNTMDLYDNVPLQFAATLIWELSKNAQGRDVISLYLKKNETAELTPLKLDGCSAVACDFKTVATILRAYSLDPQTYQDECEG